MTAISRNTFHARLVRNQRPRAHPSRLRPAGRRRHRAGRHRTRRRPRHGGREADDQRPRRREPAPAAQIQMGVGEIPLRLQQSLDADRGLHAGRHRAVEVARRPDRGRAAHAEAQSRLLRRLGEPGRQQHRAGDLPPPHQSGMPAIPAAPGLRGGGAHPHLPVHRGKPRPRRGRTLQHVPRGALDHRQGGLGAQAHAEPRRPGVPDRHAGGRPVLPARPRRLLRRVRGNVVLHRLRADPLARPAQQDGRHRRAVPVHPARREHPSELRHRRDQPDPASRTRTSGRPASRTRCAPC